MLLIIEDRSRKMSELSTELMAASVHQRSFRKATSLYTAIGRNLARCKHSIVRMDMKLISQSDPHVTCFPSASRDSDGHVLHITCPKQF